MLKKGLLFILTVFVFLSLTSCGLDYRYSLDESLHNQIEVVKEDDNLAHHLIYQGEKYMFVGDTNLFHVDTYKTGTGYYLSYKDDVMLSWNGYRYIWYIDEYYSYTSENPLFIYNERLGWVYFHEDYDYTTDTFVIANTESEIVWKDMFHSQQSSFDFVDTIKVEIYSKQCPRIKTYVRLVRDEKHWYLSLSGSQDVWIASEEFIQILSQNGLLNPPKDYISSPN
ncbi:MAG: hypothetical protein IJX19_05075 [Clostridia bacterium]|nr:hypothetical protein [Clostridia bacterium]